MEDLQYHKPGRKKFKWEFEMSGNDEVDKRKMMLAFQKAVDAYFQPRPLKSYTYLREPERL